jgi:hypothetical protein
MVDPKHPHDLRVVIDLVHNPVRAATRRPETRELPLEWVPDAAGGVDEGTQHELDDRGCDSSGQAVAATTSR